MLDVRVYRAAFLPALVALFVAAFSLADRPVPTTTGLSADAFDSSNAFGDSSRPQRNSLNELARTFPNRAPGRSGVVIRGAYPGSRGGSRATQIAACGFTAEPQAA